MFHNPSYAQTTPPPSHKTRYNSQGPKGTPTDYTPQTFSKQADHREREGEAVYHVLEDTRGEVVYEVLEDTQGEAVYHVLEDTGGGDRERDATVNYKGLIDSSPDRKGRGRFTGPSNTPGKVEKEYSTLQHL